MDTTRTSLILAVVAIAVAAVAAYLWYGQTQTVDALTDQVTSLERELNPLLSPGHTGGGNEIDRLRADLNDLTDCVNVNMSAVSQWSQYPSSEGFFGFYCKIAR